MFINANSLTINGVSMGQYILSVDYGYYKLWGKDTGRNLAGVWGGSIIGIFPKLTLQFRKLTKAEVELLAPILDSGSLTVTYYDANKKANTTMSCYSTDWVLKNKSIVDANHKADGFSWSVISRSKRV